MADESKPNYLWSLVTMRCPRCRRGPMFNNNNPWKLKKVFSMPEKCPVCKQPYELEVGFWYGTGYVSYALSVLYLIVTFVLWFALIGMSVEDNRFFWWMGLSIVSLVILQPWLMRFSRVLYLYFFVKYDKDHQTNPVHKFDN
ncbi:MAG: DUF983 domain-containing protein [Flavitalea sp.]